ncbi:MAG: hypothetical protein CMJ18_18105 [Phycisphaeraceae bacterium]|nr:hypothetical protein [Phycisphaeraceae bacterium]
MMAWWPVTESSPIGVDVGSRAIKAVQLAPPSGGAAPAVAAAAVIPRRRFEGMIDDDEARRLRDVLDRRGFRCGDVVIAVPHEHLMSDLLELPPRESGAPIRQIAAMELARTNRCDPNSFELALWDVPGAGKSGTPSPAMAAACPHEQAEELLDRFASVGLRIRAIDVASCALARAAACMLDADGPTAMLDIGATGANFVLVLDGLVVYQRRLADVGLGRLHGALQEQFGLDDELIGHLLTGEDDGAPEDGATTGAGAAPADNAISAYIEGLCEEVRASLSYAEHL